MLRLSSIPLSLLLIVLARPCLAQDGPPGEGAAGDAVRSRMTSFARTPEMWIYEQERIRYEDPKAAVRRRAELRAAQRSNRIAAMKWYGFSNSRPRVSVIPFMNSYSPYWGSNTYDPNRWRSYEPTIVVRPYPRRY